MLLGGILIVFLCVLGVVCQSQSESNEVTKKVKVSDDVLDCSTFDPKKIKLVTFDLFAALMDLDSKFHCC
jgi:ABC-type oligopeptide transport system substrate-binding subunit